jgi:hypothetical protein
MKLGITELVNMRSMTKLQQLLSNPESPIPITLCIADEDVRH